MERLDLFVNFYSTRSIRQDLQQGKEERADD